jgi:hypothetical protein
VAFLRFSRDKHGVENFYLVQPTTNRRGKVRPRVLYWFRSPPDVKVGREPFDPEVRRALETQNPDVAFDWRAIVETPIPSADADKWRERRRAERAAKHAVAEEELAEDVDGEAAVSAASDAAVGPAATVTASAAAPPAAAPPAAAQPEPGAPNGGAATRKRRRRRGGGGRGGNPPASDASAPSVPSRTEPSGD